jgi:hypothetical protein
MSKSKKTKAPLETRAEAAFWKEHGERKTPITLHLFTKETLRGHAVFATEESVAIETAEGQTQIVPREELAYLEAHE